MNTTKEKLIVIDGNSLLHRAYYALPNMTARDGTPTGAVHGFLSMLLKLVELKPDYLTVAFDVHGPTFRHKIFDEYKAGRKPTPDDLRAQFPVLKQVLGEMKIACCELEGYEADDILGTLSRRANAAGLSTLLVTGDRDALQLITDDTHVMLTKKGITETDEFDCALLMERYGLLPDNMRDLKGLMGDSSDNIPGVPGVGEKTALKLLNDYQTLENTLEHASEVKGKLGEKLSEFAEQARLSYTLGTINTAIPLERELESLRFDPADMGNALSTLDKLELRAVAARLPKSVRRESAPPKPKAKAERIEISDADKLDKLLPALMAAKTLAVCMDAGVSICVDGVVEYCIAFSGNLLEPGLEPEQVVKALAPVLGAEKPQKYVFDAKQLMHALDAYGAELKGLRLDAMIADYLLHATRPATDLKMLLGEEQGASALYACCEDMLGELEQKNMLKLYEQIEQPLIFVLYDMEKTGFNVDTAKLEELSGQMAQRAQTLENRIYELAGQKFNILSPKQLGGVLFETLGLPAQKKTKTGYSTDVEVLEKLEGQHEIVPLIQEYRFIVKLKSTFVDAMLALIDKRDGRIRTTLNQNVTATGRISSADPNLQNIPVRTEQGREIRKAFIASPGNVLVGADYSQIELRLLAHMSGDEGMISAFVNGEDIHARTAAEVFGVPLEEVTREQRSASKAVNFGIVYGISDFGLAKNLKISKKEASEYISRYLERLPGVKEYMTESVERGKRQGYAETLMGRRRELVELRSAQFNTRSFGERVAMNMPLQGSAADIIKLAMIRVYDALKSNGLKAKLILQIHDELIVDTPLDEAERVKTLLRDCMQDAIKLKVPLTVDVEAGRSWYDTK